MAMSRHLKNCHRSSEAPGAQAFHIFAGQKYAKEYWLHLGLLVGSPLSTLDGFLRDLWLECCGHMSAFTINGVTYSDSPKDGFGDRSTHIRADRVLHPGLDFTYEYDFGSTTALTLKVIAVRECDPKPGVQLLARNDPPQIFCGKCNAGKLATQVCSECGYEAYGWLCDECAETHGCGTEMLLPVVNSPRVGVCGYTG